MASTLQETVREDGLRVITKRLTSTKKVFVYISALVGSAYDASNKEGLFHFFEHMAFKGTKTRSMSEIKELLGLLVNSNAYTADLRTTYYGGAVYTKLPLLQDIIFDIYANSVFPLEEIEKEKEVVLNEAAMYEDNDTYKAYWLLGEMLWVQNPRRRVGVGTAEGLANIDQKLLLDTHQQRYVPSNTVVVAEGMIDHDKFFRDASALLPLNDVKCGLSVWDNEADRLPTNNFSLVERKNREKGVVVWGCKVPKLSAREQDVADILSNMFGGGFDSMLWSEVREKRGLVYSARSYFDDSSLASYMSFNAEMLPKRVDEVKDLIRDVVCDFALAEEHFYRVKKVMEDEHLLSLENTGAWSRLIHKTIIDNNEKLSSLNNYINKRIQRLRSITFEEVVEMRKKLVTPERMACAIVKPV